MTSSRLAVLFLAVLLSGCATGSARRFQLHDSAGDMYLLDTADGTVWKMLSRERPAWGKIDPPAELGRK